ncbi:MAG: thiamine biosynthesis protein ApbE [Rhodospirillaceae bacterium]|nr:thiamine biosynthesis protein ApbE [Rhodospirillaceae bacterium]
MVNIFCNTAPNISRRRFISITAAAAGYIFAPNNTTLAKQKHAAELHKWHGVALGAETSILISAEPTQATVRLIRLCVSEIQRLEMIFSLYQHNSVLAKLNRVTKIHNPPRELIELLDTCKEFHQLTNSAFDPTVQPLWALYNNHFRDLSYSPTGPLVQKINAVTSLVGFQNVDMATKRIALTKPGMAITLNGIAQGYITDRVVEILRDAGMHNVLVDIGETRSLGAHPKGRPWRIGIADPHDPKKLIHEAEITNEAVATSGGYGMQFDASGEFHHIFDPQTGRPSKRYLSMTVFAPSATTADALSTSFSIMPEIEIRRTLAKISSARAIAMTIDGTLLNINSRHSQRVSEIPRNFTFVDS